MALIKCIECGETISSRAQHCPHCGCPVKITLQESKENMIKEKTHKFLCKKCGSTDGVSFERDDGVLFIVCNKCWEIDEQIQLSKEMQTEHQSENKISCPFCKSTDVQKIGAISRFISVSTLGLAGKKIGKQWYCNSCKGAF